MRFRPAGRNPWTFPWQKKRNRRIDDAAMKIARGLETAPPHSAAPASAPAVEHDRLALLLKEVLQHQPHSTDPNVRSPLIWTHPAPEPWHVKVRRGPTLLRSMPIDYVTTGLSPNTFDQYLWRGVTIHLDTKPERRTSKAPEDAPEWARKASQGAD